MGGATSTQTSIRRSRAIACIRISSRTTRFVVVAVSPGQVLGFTLQTSPAAIYRALVEATAYGTRLILESLAGSGLPIGSIRVAGGLTGNEMLVGIHADVTGLPIQMSPALQASAIGAAILGAVAAGEHKGVGDAVEAMTLPVSRTVRPNAANHAVYDALYAMYSRLVNLWGGTRIPRSTASGHTTALSQAARISPESR